MLDLLSSSSFAGRRSHLDSATYRTLVRIFSLRLDDEPLNPSQPQQNPNPCPTLVSDSNGNSEPADDPNPNSNAQLVEESAKRPSADGGKDAASTKPEVEIYDGLKELELDDECFDAELLQSIMTDCEKLIDDSTAAGLQPAENLEANNQEKDVNFEKDATVEVPNGSLEFEKEAKEVTGQEIDNNCNVSKCVVNNADENEEAIEKNTIAVGTQQESCPNSDPLVECSAEKELEDGELGGLDFEDGEIPNDNENSDQSLDSAHECQVKKLVEGPLTEKRANSILADCSSIALICTGSSQKLKAFFDDRFLKSENEKTCDDTAKADVEHKAADHCASALLRENLENLEKEEEEKPSVAKVAEPQVKKKRGTLSEARKAKKKISKKRKRAQKEREQGVKRLKLQPIVKREEVKYCKYYLIGRCQQGDSCKFSHDTVPLTKSQACKYFACDSCLKGDDCPFDHELSKYPCHNYMSKGMCNRGDNCKFSHKLPVAEDSSPASLASKTSPLSSSGKSNPAKQLPTSRTVLTSTDQTKSVAAPKEPMSIPQGIRFLSFGKGPGDACKRKGEQQKQQEKNLAAGEKNESSFTQKLVRAAQSAKNMKMLGMSLNSASTSNVCKNSSEGNTRSEVSEASKLLEEFLFCGTS